MKILLIGPSSPPIGGVSVFVKRYRRELRVADHAVDVLDKGRLTILKFYLSHFLIPFKRYDVISVNVASFYVLMLLYLLGLSQKTQVIDHNWRQLEDWNGIKRRLFSAFIGKSKEVVLVGPHLQSYYQRYGVVLPRATRVQHTFIPPPLEDEDEVYRTYPIEVQRFVKRRAPLLIGNASSMMFYRGVDLYGLDMCVELIAELKPRYPNIGLLFALADVCDRTYFEKIRSRIDELGIRENFCFMTGQKELWPLFRRADLSIRPTYSDGYGISVAESLFLGCATVASDVCERADGAIVFPNRDQKMFNLKCGEVLLLWRARRQQQQEQVETFVERARACSGD